MRFLSPILLLPLFLAATPAQAQSGISGNWLTEDRQAIIRIAPCGGEMCGRIARILVETPDEDQRDTNNPDPELRDRRVLGLRILTGFRRDGERWRHGQIYDPETGRSYNARLELEDDGRLKVTGCVLGGIICQSQRWTRRR